MLISVVIPTAGKWFRLRYTISSLARQELPPDVEWEVILVLDGVAGPPPWILEGSAVPLRIVALAAPRGRGGARNAGILAARGEAVILVDDDIVAAPRLVAGHAAVQRARPSLCHGPIRELPAVAVLGDDAGDGPTRRAAFGAHPRLERHARRILADLADFDCCWDRHGHASRLERDGTRAYERSRFGVAWVAFAGANLSAPRAWLLVERFDERPGARWGLEDLGLALRWTLVRRPLTIAPEARGLHLSHTRPAWREEQRANLCCLEPLPVDDALTVLAYLEGRATTEEMEERVVRHLGGAP